MTQCNYDANEVYEYEYNPYQTYSTFFYERSLKVKIQIRPVNEKGAEDVCSCYILLQNIIWRWFRFVFFSVGLNAI